MRNAVKSNVIDHICTKYSIVILDCKYLADQIKSPLTNQHEQKTSRVGHSFL